VVDSDRMTASGARGMPQMDSKLWQLDLPGHGLVYVEDAERVLSRLRRTTPVLRLVARKGVHVRVGNIQGILGTGMQHGQLPRVPIYRLHPVPLKSLRKQRQKGCKARDKLAQEEEEAVERSRAAERLHQTQLQIDLMVKQVELLHFGTEDIQDDDAKRVAVRSQIRSLISTVLVNDTNPTNANIILLRRAFILARGGEASKNWLKLYLLSRAYRALGNNELEEKKEEEFETILDIISTSSTIKNTQQVIRRGGTFDDAIKMAMNHVGLRNANVPDEDIDVTFGLKDNREFAFNETIGARELPEEDEIPSVVFRPRLVRSNAMTTTNIP
jgi:hypothetical protein